MYGSLDRRLGWCPVIVAERLVELSDPSGTAKPAVDSGVKSNFTERRRSKRPKKDVETTEFIGAARRFIRAAGRRVGECDEHELAALLGLRDDLDAAIAEAVAGQRAYGKSWADIARGTGASREAAFQKWGRVNV